MIEPAASAVERDPLSSVVQLVFPDRVRRLDQAFAYLIQRTGYKLAPIENSDPLLPILLVSDVPEVHREIGPIKIIDAMKSLAGEPWEFVVDPVNRLVSFELRPKYRDSFENNLAAIEAQEIETLSPVADDVYGVSADTPTPKLNPAPTQGAPQVKSSFVPGQADNLSRHADALDMEAYREQQKNMLEESIALNLRSAEINEVIKSIMPSRWMVDIQVDDPTVRFAKFDITSQNSRRVVLQDFLTPLGLKIDFYPAIRPQPIAVVSGK